MKNSLNVKIIFIIIIVVSVFIISFEVYNIVNYYYHLKNDLNLSLKIISERLASSLRMLVYEYNQEQIDKYLITEMSDKNVYAIVIKDSIDNSIISGKIRDKNWDLINYNGKEDLSNYIFKNVSIKRIDEVIGTVDVYLTKRFINESLFKYLFVRTFAIFIFLGIMIITLTIFISKVILIPLKKLKDSVEVISKGDLNKPINITGNDEISSLAKSFNIMRESIIEKMNILKKKNKEKMNTEVSLRMSKEKFRTLYYNMIEGVALHQTIYNKNGEPINYKIIDINPQYESILNLKRKDVIGQLATQVYKTKTPPYLKEFANVGETGIPYFFETYYQPMRKYFSISVAQLAKGKWATIFYDITARKKAEKAFHESEYFLKKSQKVTQLGSYIFDIKKGTWISSETLDEIFGIDNNYTKDVKGWINIIHPDQRKEMLKYLNNFVIKEHNYFEKEYRIIRNNDHAERWVLGMGELEFDKRNNPIKMIGTIQDITEQIQAELALKESEEKYKQLFEVSPEAVTILDINGYITDCNNVTLHVHGYDKKEEIIGTNGFDLVAPGDREKAKNEYSSILEKNFLYNEEINLLRKNGEIFVGELSANLIRNLNGEPIGIIVITKDITERKKFEKERLDQEQVLMQVQKLKALGELAAGMAHEINQPLSGILMSVDNINIKLKDKKIEKEHIKKKMNDIYEYINRIRKIIEHVRIFSRDQRYVSSERFDINKSIKDAISLIEVQYNNHNISIHLELASDLPKISGNAYQFEQIILNFLSNSRDSLEEKERIMNIKNFKKEIIIKTFVKKKNFYFQIKDNGMGIPKENIREIFNPFFTTKDTDKGTGLGLSVSYGIIKEMNGDIEVKSEYLLFTKIILSFPMESNSNERKK